MTMYPLHQAYEVRSAVLEYIKATFRFREKELNDKFHAFVADPKTGLFRGPYISLKTPFVKAYADEKIPLEIKPGFPPHLHQIKSFRRLTTEEGHTPEPTLLTTGTGSGKTECFMFPVLDYVYKMNRDGIRKGVKVIIMYPMNALATDQAKRLAETIYHDERLRGKVTAGLFIGEGDNSDEHSRQMTPDKIIESRQAIIDTVPDILLTNFKMLDYGLMQQRYMPLWEGNLNGEPMLRFLVLDELHTYDGAQGTDVANLIRRLKLKLKMPPNHLTPIGTSATIGNGEESVELLTEYASTVFGEKFTPESIIGEERLKPEQFLPEEEKIKELPPYRQLKRLDSRTDWTAEKYLSDITRVWFGKSSLTPSELGRELGHLQIVYDLLTVTIKGINTVEGLISNLVRKNKEFASLVRQHSNVGNWIIESLLALISEAKTESNGRQYPWLFLQVQLWERELSGIQRFVQSDVEFTWRDTVPKDDRIALPMWFCRDCGASGWLSTKRITEQHFGSDASKIGQAMVLKDKDLVLLNIESEDHEPIGDYLSGAGGVINQPCYVRMEDLSIGSKNEENTIRLRAVSRQTETRGERIPKFSNDCPMCMAPEIAMIGQQTSTLSSVGVSQVMSSDFNGETQGKMLSFTNSVQDAAHLAGFYELRTFRFLFRQSLQEFIRFAGKEMSLRELQDGFKKYWKGKLKDNDGYYYRFLTDDIAKKADLRNNYRYPAGHSRAGELTDAFKKEFDLRVDWEICSEFGMMSYLGRTLEKMGSSGTYFREDTLREVYNALKPWMEANNLQDIAMREDRFIHFFNGILHRMRRRGGIDHEYLRMYRTVKLEPWALNWRGHKKEHFLHKSFGGNRVPRMTGYDFTTGKEVLDTTSMRGKRQNWFYRYFIKSLIKEDELVAVYPEQINDFYKELLQTFEKFRILNKKTADGKDNYAISPDSLMIARGVHEIKCSRCESRMYVSSLDTATEETYCLNFNCGGRYDVPFTVENNYYNRIYNRQHSPRIHAHEHTGLLERKLRERIEHEFKNSDTPQSTNVLTATSTLEMGIDIGDLNVVANVGVPPTPGNFQQRIGRAGRKTGSALVLNYSKGNRHDMYYFAEPLSMMEGTVCTPGCFLEAKDILRRHFYAYCIDSWTSADAKNTIPQKVMYLEIGYDYLTNPNFFVNRIDLFIMGNFEDVTQSFRTQYPASVQTALDSLFEELLSGSFKERILKVFEKLITKRQKIKRDRAEAKRELDVTPVNDKEKREILKDRLRGLMRLERTITDCTVLEFMTNQGLLPNYAFPETGVTFTANVFYRRPLGDEYENTADPESIELVRPASQGIRELAPGNVFYTHKLCIPIGGLAISDEDKKLVRFCSKCDAIAIEGNDEFNNTVCPKCKDESWRVNTHEMLRFTEATSYVEKGNSAITDNDERDKKIYHTMKHFQFVHNGPVTSYGIEKIGFGIEFCKDVTLMEVNYGNRDQRSETIEVNGNNHISTLGFVTCRHCGKSTSVISGNQELKDLHFKLCNHKEVGFPEDQAHLGTFERLFLYRTMHTEAIKVLLPVQVFDIGGAVEMFKSGILLGLTHYYKSSPDHLRIETYREFNQATGDFDNYLVIYDTIPGGTGYLSKLFDKTEFSILIRIAYEHIRDCECQHEGKDGCYHCILTYGNQWQRSNLSRAHAEELFKSLLDECDYWSEISGSIGTITESGVIEDSELERVFVKAMQKIAKENHWSWAKRPDAANDTYEYVLTMDDGPDKTVYLVKPQYRLGPINGVAKETRPDFQFICIGKERKGEEADISDVPQFSVYVDGYRYHATRENMGFYKDLVRREAIRNGEGLQRYSWTLTWDDLKKYVDPEAKRDFKEIDNHIVDRDIWEYSPTQLHKCEDSLSRLIYLLVKADKHIQQNEVFGFIASCSHLSHDNIAPFYKVDIAIQENARSQYSDLITDEDVEENRFFIKTDFIGDTTLTQGSAWLTFYEDEDISKKIRYDFNIKQNLEEMRRDDWHDFWNRYNLMQFFTESKTDDNHSNEDNLDAVIPLYPDMEDAVRYVYSSGLSIDLDFEGLKDADDIIIAEAAIKIKNRNIVIDDFEGREDEKKTFIEKGFIVLTPDECNHLDELITE